MRTGSPRSAPLANPVVACHSGCEYAGKPMAKLPETHAQTSPVAARQGGRLLATARYRHPGDVIRLIVAGLVLAGVVAVTIAAHAIYAGANASAVSAVASSTLAGRVLAGFVQGAFVAAALTAVVVTLRHRRFRL